MEVEKEGVPLEGKDREGVLEGDAPCVKLPVENGVWEGLPLPDLELDPVFEPDAPKDNLAVGLMDTLQPKDAVVVEVDVVEAVGEEITFPVGVLL